MLPAFRVRVISMGWQSLSRLPLVLKNKVPFIEDTNY